MRQSRNAEVCVKCSFDSVQISQLGGFRKHRTQKHFADIWIISNFYFLIPIWQSIKIHVLLSPPLHNNMQQFRSVPLERTKSETESLAPCNPCVNPASVTPFLRDDNHELCHPAFYSFMWYQKKTNQTNTWEPPFACPAQLHFPCLVKQCSFVFRFYILCCTALDNFAFLRSLVYSPPWCCSLAKFYRHPYAQSDWPSNWEKLKFWKSIWLCSGLTWPECEPVKVCVFFLNIMVTVKVTKFPTAHTKKWDKVSFTGALTKKYICVYKYPL